MVLRRKNTKSASYIFTSCFVIFASDMKKWVFIILSFISLGLGLLGMFLPMLPTTPFLLLSTFLFSKSSPRYYAWLLNHKRMGGYIRDFQENKCLPLRVKIISVSFLWISILLSVFVVQGRIWLQILLVAIAIAVTIHILSYKTKK